MTIFDWGFIAGVILLFFNPVIGLILIIGSLALANQYY